MSTATQGRRREYAVRDHLKSHGWHQIMRAAASKGSADLLMAHPIHGAALIQVGSHSKALGPADRQRLWGDAHLIGALPLLAICVPREEIRIWEVSLDKPSTWATFDPKDTKR